MALSAYFYVLSQFINAKKLIGSIEIYDDSFSKLIYPSDKHMEIIAFGHSWTESPLWIDDKASGILLYADTRANRIYRYEDGKGLFTVGKTLYIDSSGCKYSNSTELEGYCNSMPEIGSNGMIRLLDVYSTIINQGTPLSDTIDLVVCQHGERAITLIKESGARSYIATHFMGRRFNSPNDLVWSPEGHLYFTDPHYGLYDNDNEIVGKTIPFNGVYMIKADDIRDSIVSGIPTTKVTLLERKMSMPNGLAFNNDYSKLYISNSDPLNPYWNVFDVADNGTLVNKQLFYNATSLQINSNDMYGLPDGLKVDINGNIFATGPGGLIIFSEEKKIIGRIRMDRPISNVAFGLDNRLYATCSDIITRLYTKAKPTPFTAHVAFERK